MQTTTRAPARQRRRPYQARGMIPANMDMVPGPRDVDVFPVIKADQSNFFPLRPITIMVTGVSVIGTLGAIALPSDDLRRPEQAAATAPESWTTVASSLEAPETDLPRTVQGEEAAASARNSDAAAIAPVARETDGPDEVLVRTDAPTPPAVPVTTVVAGFAAEVLSQPAFAVPTMDRPRNEDSQPGALVFAGASEREPRILTAIHNPFEGLHVTLVLPEGAEDAVAPIRRLQTIGARAIDERRSAIPAAKNQVRYVAPHDRVAAAALAAVFDADLVDLSWTTSAPEAGEVSLWLASATDTRN